VKKKAEKRLPRKDVQCLAGENDIETQKNIAALICGADFAAFRVINAADGNREIFKEVDVPILMDIIRNQAGAVQGGDMSQAEAMLANQATALQSLFARLVERGMCQSTMPILETFMKLALRAQNQCRATLETLAAIKNPPVVFARQANFAHGPQMVNNGVNTLGQPPRARENKIEQTQLLEDASDEQQRLDFGATEKAGETDQNMETVGKIDRAKNSGRKTKISNARI
jgi:hypothetical protein